MAPLEAINPVEAVSPVEAISPIDGRYHASSKPLSAYFSEKALLAYRIRVEGEYLIALSETRGLGIRIFSENEKRIIRALWLVSIEDANLIKSIENKGFGSIKPTNHDVKAVEYFIKYKLEKTTLADSLEWVHFGLTSEDVNNISIGLMLRDSLNSVVLPKINKIVYALSSLAEKYSELSMLARTHGQPASPTTFGKEFKVFAARLQRESDKLSNFQLFVKLNGATGNYNAHFAAYPDVDWVEFTRKFVEILDEKENLGTNQIRLLPNYLTTQIEPADSYAELFDCAARINTILIDFSQDMWRYISDGWIIQKPKEGEVGSSTMPHKVNPIDFENCEGNLGVANALLKHFSAKLPVSRLQRDLSDSTVKRNIGVAFGYCLIGYNSLLKGLGKIDINKKTVLDALEKHPEVIAEGIQTILRREGVAMPYEKLKELTRGKEVTLDALRTFINSLDVPEKVKEEILKITPVNYTGIAQRLAK